MILETRFLKRCTQRKKPGFFQSLISNLYFAILRSTAGRMPPFL